MVKLSEHQHVTMMNSLKVHIHIKPNFAFVLKRATCNNNLITVILLRFRLHLFMFSMCSIINICMDFVCTPLTAKTITRMLHHVPCSVVQFQSAHRTLQKSRVESRRESIREFQVARPEAVNLHEHIALKMHGKIRS